MLSMTHSAHDDAVVRLARRVGALRVQRGFGLLQIRDGVLAFEGEQLRDEHFRQRRCRDERRKK